MVEAAIRCEGVSRPNPTVSKEAQTGEKKNMEDENSLQCQDLKLRPAA